MSRFTIMYLLGGVPFHLGKLPRITVFCGGNTTRTLWSVFTLLGRTRLKSETAAKEVFSGMERELSKLFADPLRADQRRD